MKSIVRRMSEDENESNGSRLACDFKSDQMRGLGHDLYSYYWEWIFEAVVSLKMNVKRVFNSE